MAMNSNNHADDELMVEMNTTPLIDVMLVLLIMLIITIPIQTHAVKLDMPVNTASTPPSKPVVVQVDISATNQVLWNGELLADRQQLEHKLSALAVQNPQPELHIKPNKDANYAPVAMVLAESQRLGVTKLGIVGAEQFVQ
ncbi:biopolymer transporter ExbD [Neisseriaceae bacterium TC5R-5]|nr:biopolymer transporter ExbD [Neisseriaceae bacterium TC5R-5]